tara:strand:+ start:2267 stop:3172 length:906 start_codon:yes stop_codon:yes gene_type:complete
MHSNILVTGGLGHIGSQLIRELPDCYNVTVIDNLFTHRYCSLFDIKRNIEFIECPFVETPLRVIQEADIIVHLAAITDALNSFNNHNIDKINIQQTKEFIDICEVESKGKLIFPSSTSVYGVASDIVIEDDDKFLNPQSPYAESKIEIENYIRSKNISYVILRFGTIFGRAPGMRFHTAINKFCYQAALNVPLTIWKQNYNQYRPYLGIHDCIKAINFFFDQNIYDETYNVITNNYKLKKIVDHIQTIKPVTLNMVNTPLLNQHSYKVDITKIVSLGFQPTDNLFKEIQHIMEMFEWLQNY